MKINRGKYVVWYFFKIDLCSAISFRRSRREHSFDVTEHRSILNITKIRTITPKRVENSLNHVFRNIIPVLGVKEKRG